MIERWEKEHPGDDREDQELNRSVGFAFAGPEAKEIEDRHRGCTAGQQYARSKALIENGSGKKTGPALSQRRIRRVSRIGGKVVEKCGKAR